MNASHPLSLPQVTPHHRDDDLVVRLRQSEIFRGYQQAFQTATGLPLVLRATGAFDAPLSGAKSANPFCALLAATSKTCAACLQMQQRVEAEAMTGPKTMACFAGLNDSMVPVRIGEKVVGFLQTGQVMFRAPTDRQFRNALKQLEQWTAPQNVAELRAAYFQTRVLARPHYEAMLRLLASFAEHLALVANELVIKEAAAEPPAVSRARAFIAEKLGEPLSLDLVAAAAHMSAFYFCKVFKSATGLTLTDYIARARVEKVKQLLLNPHTRVSEAAYEAGFQSLSQFNRVFRRIAGQAPSSYREHLHGTAEPHRAAPTLAFAA